MKNLPKFNEFLNESSQDEFDKRDNASNKIDSKTFDKAIHNIPDDAGYEFSQELSKKPYKYTIKTPKGDVIDFYFEHGKPINRSDVWYEPTNAALHLVQKVMKIKD